MSFTSFKNSQLYQRKSPNLSKLGFDFDNQNVEEEYLKIQSLLYSEYHIRCESQITIKERFNIPSGKTIDTLFKLFDIESRSFSEMTKNAIEQNRKTMPTGFVYQSCWHKTWFGTNEFLRSSYELNLAKEFDSQHIKYHVEALRIKYFDTTIREYRIAIPDFYLPESNTIVEVKSTYWYDPVNMNDKKIAYADLGYQFKLHLDGAWIF
jgi:hypothetical protein